MPTAANSPEFCLQTIGVMMLLGRFVAALEAPRPGSRSLGGSGGFELTNRLTPYFARPTSKVLTLERSHQLGCKFRDTVRLNS